MPRFRAGSVRSGGGSWRLRCEGLPGRHEVERAVGPRSTLSEQLGLDRTDGGGGTLGSFSRPSPHPRVCCLYSRGWEGSGQGVAEDVPTRRHKEFTEKPGTWAPPWDGVMF